MKTQHIILLAAVAGGLLYMLKKKVEGATVAGAAQGLGSAVVNAATGVTSGVVIGVGEVFGLPATSKSACQAAIDEFHAAPWYKQAYLSFPVSAHCTAGEYFEFLSSGAGPDSAVVEASNKQYQGAGTSAGGSGSVLDWSLSATGPSQGSFSSGQVF